MSLETYNKKRDFGHTPEPGPVPETPRKEKELIFVVQLHDASHLHFDFRLEWDGVLKSWAVPKGPSMNPKDKRLAVMVEDHPLDYAGFAGEIPDGNYGAGTVWIWDHGTWKPTEKIKDPGKALEQGSLEFILEGDKLKGKFVLIELKNSSVKNGWLLIKKHDGEEITHAYDAYEIEVNAENE